MEVDLFCNLRLCEPLFEPIEHLSAFVQRERVRKGKVGRLSRGVAELVTERHEKLLCRRATANLALVVICPSHLLLLIPGRYRHKRVVDLAWNATPCFR